MWENPNIAAICSQMPNVQILMSNIAAALNKTKLSSTDAELLQQHARETSSGYCAGCADICENAVEGPLPVCDVMRYLMYCHSYGEPDRARELYGKIPATVRSALIQADYSAAERSCPQQLPIAALMREAAQKLA